MYDRSRPDVVSVVQPVTERRRSKAVPLTDVQTASVAAIPIARGPDASDPERRKWSNTGSMKILYLCADPGIPVFGTKGASVHVRALISAFRRAGHDVTLVAPVLVRHESDETSPVDATVRHRPFDDTIKSATARLRATDEVLGTQTSIANEVRRVLYNQSLMESLLPELELDRPDVIYERLSLMGTAGVEIARRLSIPLLLEVNAPLSLETAAYRRLHLTELASLSEQHAIRAADAVLAVSAPVREHAIGLGAAPDRVHVLPNAIDPELFSPRPRDDAVRAGLGAREGDVLLGFVGGLRPWHGVDLLPQILGALVARGRPVRMVIAGDGQLRAELEREFRQRDLDGYVCFTGALDHHAVAALTAQLDIALAPYPQLDHAFYFSPLKLFEYMGAGAAVVASRIGQIAEVVRDGETGVLTPPGDVAAVVSACERLIAEPDIRRALGQAASRQVHATYTWDHNAERAVDLARSRKPAGGAA